MSCLVRRSLLKVNHDGLNLMNSVIHAVLFNAHPQWAPCNHNVPQMLQKTLTEGSMNILCEALKILFNQTVHWSEDSHLAKVIVLLCMWIERTVAS